MKSSIAIINIYVFLFNGSIVIIGLNFEFTCSTVQYQIAQALLVYGTRTTDEVLKDHRQTFSVMAAAAAAAFKGSEIRTRFIRALNYPVNTTVRYSTVLQ